MDKFTPTEEELKELGFYKKTEHYPNRYARRGRICYDEAVGFFLPEDVPSVYPKSLSDLRSLVSMMEP